MSNSSSGPSVDFFGLLAIVFIALKLAGVIDWSWWWVTAPLWMPFVVIVPIVFIWLMVSK